MKKRHLYALAGGQMSIIVKLSLEERTINNLMQLEELGLRWDLAAAKILTNALDEVRAGHAESLKRYLAHDGPRSRMPCPSGGRPCNCGLLDLLGKVDANEEKKRRRFPEHGPFGTPKSEVKDG